MLGDLLSGQADRAARARSRRRRRSRARSGRTRSAVCPGCTSWPGSAWAASSPTTWAWARPRRRCRCCSPNGIGRPGRARRCSSARCRWSATGRRRPARFAPACGSTSTTAATRKREDEFLGRGGGRPTWSSPPTAPRCATSARCATSTWGRVVCDEAQAIKNSGTRQAQAVRAIPARTRLALTGTPVENHLAELWSIMEFCNPGLLGPAKTVPAPLPGTDRGAAGRRRHRGAQAGDRPVRAAPAEDRQVDHLRPAGEERDEGVVHAHRRAGHALPGRGRGHDGRHRGQRGHPAAGQRDRRDDQAQAGLQPPGPPAQGRLPAARPIRQAGPARGADRGDHRRGRQGPGLHPVRRVRLAAAAVPRGPPRPAGAVAARWTGEGASATSWSSGSRPTTSRWCSCSRSRRPAPAST